MLLINQIKYNYMYSRAYRFYSYSAGIYFSRQNLTSTDRRQILTSKIDPRTVRVKLFKMAVDP